MTVGPAFRVQYRGNYCFVGPSGSQAAVFKVLDGQVTTIASASVTGIDSGGFHQWYVNAVDNDVDVWVNVDQAGTKLPLTLPSCTSCLSLYSAVVPAVVALAFPVVEPFSAVPVVAAVIPAFLAFPVVEPLFPPFPSLRLLSSRSCVSCGYPRPLLLPVWRPRRLGGSVSLPLLPTRYSSLITQRVPRSAIANPVEIRIMTVRAPVPPAPY